MSASNRRTLHVAVAQMGPVHLTDPRERVVARLVAMLRDASARGAELVVFPELALTTFFPRYWMELEEAIDRFFERSMPNPAVQPLFDEARRLGIGFCLGYAEFTPEGRRFNTAVLVGRNGEIVGRYRKIHIPGHAEHKPEAPFQHLEMRFFEPGDLGFRVFDTRSAAIGMLVCNDRRWPESYRVLALQGCELVLVGYNSPLLNIHWNEPAHLRMFHNHLTLQASAYHNSLWIGSAAKCGREDGFQMIGGSVIVAPTGEIVARATSEDDEVIVARIDLSLGDEFRRNVFNFEKHRRPDQYRLIVERTAAGPPVC